MRQRVLGSSKICKLASVYTSLLLRHDSIRANFNDAIEPSPAAVEATSFHTEAFFQRSSRAATEKVPSVELMEEFGRLGGFSAIVQRLREPTHVGFARLRVFVRLAHVSRHN